MDKGGAAMKLIEIRKIFQENNGIMKTSELYKNGVTKYEIKKFTDSEFFERISTGYYRLYEEEISDIKLISILLPEAVLCFDTALYNYGYSDRTPTEWHLAIDKDISKSRVRIDYPYIKAYYVEHNLIHLGVEDIIIEDIRMKIYSRDRLICDCLKYERKMTFTT